MISALNEGSRFLFASCRKLSALLPVWLVVVFWGAVPVQAENLPSFDCIIHPNRTADLALAVPGVIEQVYVSRADRVTAGDVVAALEGEIEKATVELARARAAIKSEIALGKVEVDFSVRRTDQVEYLYKRKTVPHNRFDDAVRERELSSLRLQQAQELSVIRKLELRRAEEQLKQKTLNAPFDGYVVEVYRSEGEYVEGQPIVRLAQLDPLHVEAIIPIEFFGRITAGMVVEIQPEFSGTDVYVGSVEVVDPVGDAASGTFVIRATLANPDNKLPAGLRCGMRFGESMSSSADLAPGVQIDAADVMNIAPSSQ